MRCHSRLLIAVCVSACLLESASISAAASAETPADGPADGPVYTADGRLILPENYREWIFLSSGLNMSYNPSPQAASHPMFNNVFVNPSAYRAYQQTGTWPDKTLLVLENRGGESGHSINTRGTTQSAEVMGLEIHVKDATGPQAGWGFFSFDESKSAPLVAKSKDCYSCHQDHAAVDTTFVQFYPTLMGTAQQKGTLSPAFIKDGQKNSPKDSPKDGQASAAK